jgi:hypothetical protein
LKKFAGISTLPVLLHEFSSPATAFCRWLKSMPLKQMGDVYLKIP